MCPMVRRPPGMELALLGFLRQGPRHGYEIYQLLSDPSGLGSIWRLKQSQLYALLTKLEIDGYTLGKLEALQTAHPPRRMFQLTKSGQVAYRNWLKSPVNAPRLMRQEFMAKYYFACREGQAHTHALINLQRTICQGWLESMKTEKVEPASFHWQVQQYRIGQIEASLTWLEGCLEDIV